MEGKVFTPGAENRTLRSLNGLPRCFPLRENTICGSHDTGISNPGSRRGARAGAARRRQ